MAIGNALKQGIFVVAAKRTPFGAFGGSLKSFTPTDLQVSILILVPHSAVYLILCNLEEPITQC